MSYPSLEFFQRTLDDEGNVKELNQEVLDYIRKRYSPVEVPPCRVCGGELLIVGMSDGKISYAHPRPEGAGFDEWNEHYTQSKWSIIGSSDEYVIALLNAYENLIKP